ncbi:MAG TPA: NHL repeat-containing protein, partial [Nitrososphaera sp.]|nr:NHL repeat-containing protein [Nitrososphaera sp.]
MAICEPSVSSSYLESYQEKPLYPGICNPVDAVFDPAGNLWVADKIGRVLEFKSPFVNGENATTVIGQANFTGLSTNVDAATISNPGGLAFDSSGNLWLSDQAYHRILEFKRPFTNGMPASLVIGQPDFISQSPTGNPTQSSLESPSGITFDAAGNLWVADTGFSRVVEFKPPFSNGQDATLVIGADNFTWSKGERTQSSLEEPVAIMFDAQGALWVTDAAGGRILKFEPPFSNGEAASVVIGKRDFTQVFESAPNFTFLSHP